MKFFNVPFAADGDKEEIPNPAQPDGSVSYLVGFGTDYELPNTDPNYKPIPRDGFNQLMNDITASVGFMQANGFYPWQDNYPYPIAATVRHAGQNWVSTVSGNMGEPGVNSGWRRADAIDSGVIVFDDPGVTSWTVPDVLRLGLRKAHVTVVGGGGGGGGGEVTEGPRTSPFGGAGGGGAAIDLIDLTSVETVMITVGAGGSGGLPGGQAGAGGGSSSFGSYVSATGGGGAGDGSSLGFGSSGGFGAGGAIRLRGGAGHPAHQVSGGGSAIWGGGGGASFLGGGSRGGSSVSDPPGIGGGGGSKSQGIGSIGGAGIVIIRW